MAGFTCQKVLISALFLVSLTACSPFLSKKPPVVLVLLESFSEKDFLCSDQEKLENFFELQEVCDQFIRFTHAYAPSSLTQPNLSSLFTGLPISQHGVRHNGSVGLSGRLQTLSEAALDMEMRTAFFSGGVPVLSKFGISQGFEEFSEPFKGKSGTSFQSLGKSVSKAFRWLDYEVKDQSFLLALYAPDLLYKNLITQDRLDNERPIGYQSSIEEIYESINDLIAGLKKRKKWENTHLVVLGLNGPHPSINPRNPLSGQMLHVPLQIKVAHKLGTNLESLTSEIVSFHKLGDWLQKIVNHRSSQGDLIFTPDPEDRFIPQQNSWAQWLGLSDWVTYGLRKKQYLFSFNPTLEVYDTFFDKKEYEPLLAEEANKLKSKFDLSKKAKSFFPDICVPGFSANNCAMPLYDMATFSQITTLRQWVENQWPGEQPIDDFNQKLNQAIAKKQEILINWLAYRALVGKHWGGLFELGQKNQNSSWTLLAQMNLREPIDVKRENCLKYFRSETQDVDDFYKHCPNSGLRRVVEGLNLLKQRRRPSDRFWAQVGLIKARREALNLNLSMLFTNHLEDPFDFGPSLSELYFFLPKNRDYLSLIQADES